MSGRRLDGARQGAEAPALPAPAAGKEKPPVPLRHWAMWWATLVFADILFYVLLTPIWIGLRAVAWVAEFRARRRGPRAAPRPPA